MPGGLYYSVQAATTLKLGLARNRLGWPDCISLSLVYSVEPCTTAPLILIQRPLGVNGALEQGSNRSVVGSV